MTFFNLFKKTKEHSSPEVPNEVGQTNAKVEVKAEAANSAEAEANPKKEGEENKTQNLSGNQTDTTSAKSKTIHNLIILDESGSMSSIYRPALDGVNETIQTIRCAEKEHEDQKHFVSLVAFDTGHYNEIYRNTPAEKAVDITEKQYWPDGGTPLYDAMGRAINDLRSKVEKDDTVLVTVITDGYENSSREYSGKDIKALVETMKAEGWVFTYIGANQDVEAVAKSMSIDNKLRFHPDAFSTNQMFENEKRSRKNFYLRVSKKLSKEDLQNDFFSSESFNEKKPE